MAVRRMAGMGSSDSNRSGTWSSEYELFQTNALGASNPWRELEEAAPVEVEPDARTAKSEPESDTQSDLRAPFDPCPSSRGYSGREPGGVLSRNGIVTAGVDVSGSSSAATEERHPTDLLVAVTITLLMLGAIASKVL